MQANYLPTKPINTLPERVEYPIYKSKPVQTKYGRSILVWLYDQNTKERFKVFLPSAICKRIADADAVNSSDDICDNSIPSAGWLPSSVASLPHYKMAYYGTERLKNGCTKYDVRFAQYDHLVEIASSQ